MLAPAVAGGNSPHWEQIYTNGFIGVRVSAFLTVDRYSLCRGWLARACYGKLHVHIYRLAQPRSSSVALLSDTF